MESYLHWYYHQYRMAAATVQITAYVIEHHYAPKFELNFRQYVMPKLSSGNV